MALIDFIPPAADILASRPAIDESAWRERVAKYIGESITKQMLLLSIGESIEIGPPGETGTHHLLSIYLWQKHHLLVKTALESRGYTVVVLTGDEIRLQISIILPP